MYAFKMQVWKEQDAKCLSTALYSFIHRCLLFPTLTAAVTKSKEGGRFENPNTVPNQTGENLKQQSLV